MSTIQQALLVLAARILSLITGAALEYEVYPKQISPLRRNSRQREEGIYSGTRSECRRYIEEEIRGYHKVFSGFGVRPTGQLLLDGSDPILGSTESQKS